MTWTEAKSNPDPGLRFLGVGLDLATSEALELLSAGAEVAEPIQTNALDLMRSAEGVLRRCLIEDLPVGASQLVAAICDLLREHTP